MDYAIHIVIMVGLYSILAVSLNLISGYAGLMSIANAACCGIGAYSAAIMAVRLHSPFLVIVCCGLVAGGLFGSVLSIAAIRVRDDYFAMATFAIQVVVYSVMNNWISLTGGPMGLPGIPVIVMGNVMYGSGLAFLILTWAVCGIVWTVAYLIVHSSYGRVLRAMREDEIVLHSAGWNIGWHKLTICAIGGGMSAVAGVLFAYYYSFIDPSSFSLAESVFMLAIVIIGGAGSMWGPVLGATFFIVVPELLRFLGLPASVAAGVRQILYGALLVICMIWRPQGIVGRYALGARRTDA